MTGFGLAEARTPSGSYRVEIRGVNNRFLDLQLRLPRIFSNLEQKIKKEISAAISRGSVSVFFSSDQPAGRWEEERFFDEEAKRLGAGHFLFIVPHDQLSRQTIDFILYDGTIPAERRYRYLSEGQIAGMGREEVLARGPAAFICSPNLVGRRALEDLRAKIGRGEVAEFKDKFGRLLAYTLTVDRQSEKEPEGETP
ncbi:MAG: hypothetical protein NTV79_11445 [Candidatus Aureabacteria bacterium]|nr:hypothetical protein [Candidatus Auribacterota bacterium]